MKVQFTLGVLAIALGVSSRSAHAQAKSFDYTRECDQNFSKGAAYTYLTGKPGPNTASAILTSGNKKLELGKGALEVVLGTDPRDRFSAGFVSIPFTAIGVRARLIYTPVKEHRGSDVFVCHYALKDSATGWGSFEMNDLKALIGRRLIGIGPRETASVLLGGSAPPSGYRSSTVAVAFVVRPSGSLPTVTLQLKTEKH